LGRQATPTNAGRFDNSPDDAEGEFVEGESNSGSGRLQMRIIIEPEEPGDSRALFRLLVGERLVAEGMTAAQIHLLVGDVLEKMTLQKGQSGAAAAEPSRATISDEDALPDLPKIDGEPYDGSPV
jgi:hypothetical protein